MAVPTRFDYSFGELAKLLIKDQEIHEGRWIVGFDFGLTGVHTGASPSEVRPGALIQVNRVVLVRADENFVLPPESALIVDAAEVNPALGGTKKPKATRK